MGLNIETFFVNSTNMHDLIDLIKNRLSSSADFPNQQPDWGLESSYDLLLANEKRRKVILSPIQNGWITGIESKEVVDFALLQKIAFSLQTDVIVVQLSETVGTCGYAKNTSGVIIVSYFSETEIDPRYVINKYLCVNGIAQPLVRFKDAIQLISNGWKLL